MHFQLDTGSVPMHERAEFWRDAMLTVLKARCHVVPKGTGPFDASVGVMACGPLDLVEVAGTAYSSARSRCV